MVKIHLNPSPLRLILLGFLLALPCFSCAPGGIGDQVLKDFRIRQPDPDTQTEAIKQSVRQKLDRIGSDELIRLNENQSAATVKFMADPTDSFGGGRFYKAQARYEKSYVGEIKRSRQIKAHQQTGSRGFEGELEFVYRIYESPRYDRPDEARAAEARLETDQTGSLFLKYSFDSAGNWDGNPGQETKQ